MNRRTRLFVFAASAILLAGIGTAGVASWVGLGNIGLLASDASDELSYVPGDAQLLVYLDVRHVMDSDLRHTLQSDLGVGFGSAPSRLFDETGINIETDVDSIVLATFPGAGDTPAGRPLVIARGRFDESHIEASFRSRGGAVTEYRGTPFLTSPDNELTVAFIKSGMLAVGTPASVRLALDTGQVESGTVKQNAEVMRLVDRVDAADAWTVARFDALHGNPALPSNLATQLPSITWLAAGGRINDGVSAVLHAETRDEQAAKDLHQVVQGLVALVRMQVGQQAEFAELMNSVELTGDGNTVSLSFAVSAEMIQRLAALRPRPAPVPAAAPSI